MINIELPNMLQSFSEVMMTFSEFNVLPDDFVDKMGLATNNTDTTIESDSEEEDI